MRLVCRSQDSSAVIDLPAMVNKSLQGLEKLVPCGASTDIGLTLLLCLFCSLVIDVVGIEDYTTNVKAQTEAGLINVDLGEGNYYYVSSWSASETHRLSSISCSVFH